MLSEWREKITRAAKVVGVCIVFGFFLVTCYLILSAYFNNYLLGIYINEYGEANLEVFMIIFSLPLSAVLFYDNIKNLLLGPTRVISIRSKL